MMNHRTVALGPYARRLVAGLALVNAQRAGGANEITVSGELRQWHKVTLTLAESAGRRDGECAEPISGLSPVAVFTHESGTPSYSVPGYFAGDGNAANSSATSGNKWRAHLAPDKTGRWNYRYSVCQRKRRRASAGGSAGQAVAPLHGRTGTIQIAASDKRAPDFRARGRLQYAGKHYLQFAGSGGVL